MPCVFLWHIHFGSSFRRERQSFETGGRRRRGRPRLRWEDCVKRDVKKAGEEEDWKKKTRDRGGWKSLSDEAVKKFRAAPHPWQREKEEREERRVSERGGERERERERERDWEWERGGERVRRVSDRQTERERYINTPFISPEEGATWGTGTTRWRHLWWFW